MVGCVGNGVSGRISDNVLRRKAYKIPVNFSLLISFLMQFLNDSANKSIPFDSINRIWLDIDCVCESYKSAFGHECQCIYGITNHKYSIFCRDFRVIYLNEYRRHPRRSYTIRIAYTYTDDRLYACVCVCLSVCRWTYTKLFQSTSLSVKFMMLSRGNVMRVIPTHVDRHIFIDFNVSCNIDAELSYTQQNIHNCLWMSTTVDHISDYVNMDEDIV